MCSVVLHLACCWFLNISNMQYNMWSSSGFWNKIASQMSLEIMFENLCCWLIWFISKDALRFLNQTVLSLPSKPLLAVYSCLWLTALLWFECMCVRTCLWNCVNTAATKSLLITPKCLLLADVCPPVTPCCTQRLVGERKVLYAQELAHMLTLSKRWYTHNLT